MESAHEHMDRLALFLRAHNRGHVYGDQLRRQGKHNGWDSRMLGDAIAGAIYTDPDIALWYRFGFEEGFLKY